jgi:hypothetical protein
MKNQTSINWGRWRRENEQGDSGLDRIQSLSRLVKIWAIAAILITIALASAGVLLNYWVGLESAEKIDTSTRHMVKLNEASISRALDAINPNSFLFKLIEDSGWHTPTPAKEYVKLNILPVPSRKITLDLKIKNNSDFPARYVYCIIAFSSQEFVETGDDIVRGLSGQTRLNVYPVDSSGEYLNEAAAFEWTHIPPKAQRAAGKKVDLTMKGNSGRLTVKINSTNKLAFEFKLQE